MLSQILSTNDTNSLLNQSNMLTTLITLSATRIGPLQICPEISYESSHKYTYHLISALGHQNFTSPRSFVTTIYPLAKPTCGCKMKLLCPRIYLGICQGFTP